MGQRRIRAAFIRGGTSKAVVFRREDLPEHVGEWPAIFREIMGSPDSYGRQLDGMGGGLSSLSKVCVVGPAQDDRADVDYTFAQIGVEDGAVDFSGNCGNMSAAIGPFAIDEGMVTAAGDGETTLRIHNTNTGKIIRTRFAVKAGRAVVGGDLSIDGVCGTGAPIALEFCDPGGTATGQLLPTGRAADQITLADRRTIEASLVDAANPCIFVRARGLDKSGAELPDALYRDRAFLASMEEIRRRGAMAMGLADTVEQAGLKPANPKIAIVAPTAEAAILSGRIVAADEADISIRMLSMGQPHRAVPVTGALCVAVAARIGGTVVAQILAEQGNEISETGAIRVSHPSGIILVEADVSAEPGHTPAVRSATVYRTARRLFEGHVLLPEPSGTMAPRVSMPSESKHGNEE